MSGGGARGDLPRRGSIWWVDLDPTREAKTQAAPRGGIERGRAQSSKKESVVVVTAVDRPPPHPPIIVAVSLAGEDSVAIRDQLRAVDRTRLSRSAGALSRADLRAVEDGVRAVLLL